MRKPVKLACFDILPAEEKVTKKFEFLKDITEALKASKNVPDRTRELSELAEKGEQQFIAKVSSTTQGIFCNFLHLKAGAPLLVSEKLFNKKSFSFGDIKEGTEKDIKGHIKGHTCFLMTNDLFIWKSTRDITVPEISIYINWLLKKNLPRYTNRNSVIMLKPHLKKTFNPLTVGRINIGKDVSINKGTTLQTVIEPIVNDLVKKIMAGKSTSGFDPKTIFKASLVLTLITPPKEDLEKSKKDIQSILDAVKSEETNLFDKKGNSIKESAVKETKEARVGFITPDFPDEAELEQEMRSYLEEVK